MWSNAALIESSHLRNKTELRGDKFLPFLFRMAMAHRVRTAQEETVTDKDELLVVEPLHQSAMERSLDHHVSGDGYVKLVVDFVFDETDVAAESGQLLHHPEERAATGEHCRVTIVEMNNMAQ